MLEFESFVDSLRDSREGNVVSVFNLLCLLAKKSHSFLLVHSLHRIEKIVCQL